MRLTEKAAIVTGAGSGIGRAIACLFSKEGARVMVADLDRRGGEDTVELLKEEGGEGRFVQCDVSKLTDVEKAVETASDSWGGVNILVNNAGLLRKGTILDGSEQDWDAVMAVNLKGTYYFCRAVIPTMIDAGGGAIVNIASVGGLVGAKNLASYSTSKGAVVNLTRQIAVDYGPVGVRANTICPGTIVTPMNDAFYTEENREEKLAMWAEAKPLRKLGYPEDIAYAALYLASDESRYVTGAVLVVDGGAMAQL